MMRPLGFSSRAVRIRFSQRVIGMRIVHHHEKFLAEIDVLEAPGDAFEIADAGFDDLVGYAQRLRGANCGQECCRR